MRLTNTQGYFFNKNDPKHKCLCGLVHVERGTEIFVGIQAVGTVIGLLSAVIKSQAWPLIFLWLPMMIIGCTLLAIKKEDHRLMWPIIIYTGSSFGLLILCAIFTVVVFIKGLSRYEFSNQMSEVSLFFFVIEAAFIACTVISFWQLWVFIKCQRYYADFNRAKIAPSLMYSNEHAGSNAFVIQSSQYLQPPFQQGQLSAEQLMQQEQFQLQQQFQQMPYYFQPPPAYDFAVAQGQQQISEFQA